MDCHPIRGLSLSCLIPSVPRMNEEMKWTPGLSCSQFPHNLISKKLNRILLFFSPPLKTTFIAVVRYFKERSLSYNAHFCSFN